MYISITLLVNTIILMLSYLDSEDTIINIYLVLGRKNVEMACEIGTRTQAHTPSAGEAASWFMLLLMYFPKTTSRNKEEVFGASETLIDRVRHMACMFEVEFYSSKEVCLFLDSCRFTSAPRVTTRITPPQNLFLFCLLE